METLEMYKLNEKEILYILKNNKTPFTIMSRAFDNYLLIERYKDKTVKEEIEFNQLNTMAKMKAFLQY